MRDGNSHFFEVTPVDKSLAGFVSPRLGRPGKRHHLLLPALSAAATLTAFGLCTNPTGCTVFLAVATAVALLYHGVRRRLRALETAPPHAARLRAGDGGGFLHAPPDSDQRPLPRRNDADGGAFPSRRFKRHFPQKPAHQ